MSRMTAQERRSQLVEVGKQVFAELGFNGATIEEIAARAGVSKPIVYEHFGGKEGLYAVVVDREVTRLLGVITNRLTAATGGREHVWEAAMAFLDYIEDDPDGFRVLTRDSPATFGGGGFGGLLEDVALKAEEILGQFFTRSGVRSESAPIYARALTGMVSYVGSWWAEQREPSKEVVAAHVTAISFYGLSRLPRDAGGSLGDVAEA